MSKRSSRKQEFKDAQERVVLRLCETLGRLQSKHERGTLVVIEEAAWELSRCIRALEAYHGRAFPHIPVGFAHLDYESRREILREMDEAI